MSVTKAYIVNSIHKENGLSKEKAGRVVDSLFEIVKRALEGAEDVMISGFGKFCVKEKGKRPARNMQSGEAVTLDARRVVTFKCSGVLRDRINLGGDSSEL